MIILYKLWLIGFFSFIAFIHLDESKGITIVGIAMVIMLLCNLKNFFEVAHITRTKFKTVKVNNYFVFNKKEEQDVIKKISDANSIKKNIYSIGDKVIQNEESN